MKRKAIDKILTWGIYYRMKGGLHHILWTVRTDTFYNKKS